MKTLAIDTSSKLCGVCILEDKKELIRIDKITNKSHSEKLMPIISDAFSKTNLDLNDIDLIVCDKGPGSFTGIRIGVATTKGFADSLNIKTIGVSSLEVLAFNVKTPGYICSIINAKNNNCYFAVYKFENNTYTQIENPQATSVEEMTKIIKKYFNKKDSNTLFTFVGDGVDTFFEILNTKFSSANFSNINEINSYNLGLAGICKLENNDSSDILPLYLRKSQAERLSEK